MSIDEQVAGEFGSHHTGGKKNIGFKLPHRLFVGSPGDKARGIQKLLKTFVNRRLLPETSTAENRNAIVSIQWFVAIGTSYLLLSANEWKEVDPFTGLLIAVLLLSVPSIRRLPDEAFEKRLVEPGVLIFDTVLIVSAIGLTRNTPWDLFILFFFCVFLAATGENLIYVVVGCFMLSVVFVFFMSAKPDNLMSITPDLLIRVPFMFGISVLYGHLIDQIKKQKRRLQGMEEAETIKRQFVSSLAHDIKSPLMVILGHAEVLSWEDTGRSDEKTRQNCLLRIQENVQRIVKLITGLLDITRLGTTKVQKEQQSVQLNHVIQDVVQQQMVTLRKKGLSVSFNLDENLKEVFGNKDQLERALWNLVDNAIKYTPEGGSVSLNSRMENNCLRIEVKDNGVGIPPAELPLVFAEFKQLNNAAGHDGTGLGLFIVKTIVESHGGTVTAESQEGAGTTITVLLPEGV